MESKNSKSSRKLKLNLIQLLKEDSTEHTEKFVLEHNSKLISPLFAVSYSIDSIIKWNAIAGFGIISKYLAEIDKEKLREIIRKCIWMLTEESGGIAWTAPAIIGEVLANNKDMADEYSDILFSYVYEAENEPENFLDHPPLRNSALWGIQRLLQNYPEKINKNEYIIRQRIEVEVETELLANLLLIVKFGKLKDEIQFVSNLLGNISDVNIFFDNKLQKTTLSELAEDVIKSLEN